MFLSFSDLENTQRIIVDIFEFVRWEPSYNNKGVFEVSLPKETAKKIKKDMIVTNSEDKYFQGIVKYFEFDTNEGIDSFVKIKGYFLSCILEQRICMFDFEYEDQNLNTAINQILQKATENGRLFYGKEMIISFSSPDLKNLTVSYGNENASFFEILKGLCEILDLGFRVNINEFGIFVLTVYNGLDLSENLIFSSELDTAFSLLYSVDSSQEINFVYAVGDDDIIEKIDLRDSPKEELKEGVYSSDVKRKNMSIARYRKILKSKVLEQKEKFKSKKIIETSTNSQNRIKYGKDYKIGDIVTQKSKEHGVSVKTRITGVCQMWSVDGYTISVSDNNL